MRRFLSLLVCLSLLAGCVSFSAAETAAVPAPPPVGETVYGFEVLQTREVPMLGATVTLFEHQKTGAKLMYIANGDTNRVFDLTFLTRPTDNTGLPHVFEHSTLDGSARYPSKTLWFNLAYQTYNTYMNASTSSAYTTYPVASLSEEQLLRLADFYTDSCLHPMVLEDESIYREEAWRYRLESLESDLTIEGTVYSEMQGATTLTRKAGMNAYRVAFPGSVVGNDHGGDPADIPGMTWESLKNYHSLFYHPSNCIAYLYGFFDDYTAFLKLLDEAFAGYEKADFHFEDSGYTPITAPQEASFGFPAEAGSAVEHQSMIYYYIVCPGLKDDPQEELVLNTLTDLMIADSSVLQQSLKKALPTGQFGCYIETNAPDDAICFYAVNVNEGDGPLFRQTVDAALAQIAQEGFQQEMVDGVMTSLSLSTLLVTESSSVGTDMIPTIAFSYAASGRPYDYFDYVEALAEIDNWNQQGLYQAAVEKWLVGSELTALVTTYPVPGAKEEEDAALAARLAEVKAAMSPEELQALVDQTNAPEPEEDNTAMIASLQAVTVESLPEELRVYPITDETDESGVRHINATVSADGVSQPVIFLNANALSQDDLLWFKLYTQLLGKMDTSAHTHEELSVLSTRLLYDGSIRQSLVGRGDDYNLYLRANWTAMNGDLADGYDLVYELLFDTQFTDTARLGEQVTALKAAQRASINSAPYNTTLYRSLGASSGVYRMHAHLNYLDYYTFLEEVEQQMQTEPRAVAERLAAVQGSLRNSFGAVMAFAGSENSIERNRPLADAFLARLDHTETTRVTYDLPAPAASEALIADTSVQFNGVVSDFAAMGLEEFDGSLDVMSTLVADLYLVPRLRDQYGVYSPWAGAVPDGGVYLLTYRDPNVRETFAVYEALPEYLRSLSIDQETLNGYILSAYAGYAKPTGEFAGALSAILNVMEGRPQTINLTYMRQLKEVTPATVGEYADRYAGLIEKGIRSTAGSAGAINANADLYARIFNPFGAVDASQVSLTDVAEDDPRYAAIRFVFESGLMQLAGDSAFAPDEPATAGDLMAAVYTGVGGPQNDPEGARDWLAGYGLVPADQDVNAPLTEELLCSIMVNGLGVGLSTDTPEAVVPRSDLADLLFMIFGQSAEGEEPAEAAEGEEPSEAAEGEEPSEAAEGEEAAPDAAAAPGQAAEEAAEPAEAEEAEADGDQDAAESDGDQDDEDKGDEDEAGSPAVTGDLLAALAGPLGLTESTAEAVKTFLVSAGAMAEDFDLNAPLTEQAACDIIALLGGQLQTDTPDQAMTLADLAELMGMLFPAAAVQ